MLRLVKRMPTPNSMLGRKRMKPSRIMALAIAAAFAVSAGVTAAPAHAELITKCEGEGGAVTVPGDLVVPKNRACELNGTTVEGDVRVAPGADLIMNDATIEGKLTIVKDGYADTDSSTVDGARLVHAFGMMASTTTFADDVVSRPADTSDGFIELDDSTLKGSLRSRSGELVVRGTDITRDLIANGAYSTEVLDSFIDGKSRVNNNKETTVFCGGAVQGSAVFDRNSGNVQLGVTDTPSGCTSPTYWGKRVRISNTRGNVLVDNVSVNGDLVLRKNASKARLGHRVVIRGDVIGKYETVDLASAASRSDSSAPPARTHTPQVESKAKERKAQALKKVRKTGTAHLG